MNIYGNLRKVVFPVGGLGTRFLPITKSVPKEMLPVFNKPLIQHAFEEAREAGIEQFIFITGRNKSAINNHFDYSYELQSVLSSKNRELELQLTTSWLPSPGKIIFTRQQEPLGLGHAIYCAKDIIGDEPFAVILADEMLQYEGGALKAMIKLYNATKANIIGVAPVAKEDINRYGIVHPEYENDLMKITDMIEKPHLEHAPSDLSIAGRYVLHPQIFHYLEKTKPDKKNEIQLTDAMKMMLQDHDFYGVKFNCNRFDCGSYVGYLEANIAYSMADSKIRPQILKYLKKFTHA